MADLEEVDRRDRASADERRLDRGLRVASEQGREARMAEQQHDRAVVDVALREWCGCIDHGRVDDLDRGGSVEREPLPGARDADRHAPPDCGVGEERAVRGVLEVGSGVQEGPDAEAVEDVHEAGDVVLVRVREDHDVDGAPEERQVRAEAAQR